MGRWVARVLGRGLDGWGLEGCALPVGLLFEVCVNVGRFIVVSLFLCYYC